MTEVRFAIVGTGAVSRQVAADLALTGNSRLVAVCSRSMAAGTEFVRDLSVDRVYTDLDRCVADSDVDIVYIATPHATHHPLGMSVLRAGKHALIEKPMALHAGEVRELQDEARRAGVFLMEAMWTKFNVTIRNVQTEVETGAVGAVRSVRASFGIPFPEGVGSRWRPDLGGSALLDQGIYAVTLASMFLGRPAEVRARGVVRPDGIDLTEHVTLEYADGRFAQLASSMVEFIDPSASINGTSAYITIDPAFWTPERATLHALGPDSVTDQRELGSSREGFGYVPMLRAVSETIMDGRTEHPLHTVADTLGMFEVLDEVRRQLRTTDNAPDLGLRDPP